MGPWPQWLDCTLSWSPGLHMNYAHQLINEYKQIQLNLPLQLTPNYVPHAALLAPSDRSKGLQWYLCPTPETRMSLHSGHKQMSKWSVWKYKGSTTSSNDELVTCTLTTGCTPSGGMRWIQHTFLEYMDLDREGWASLNIIPDLVLLHLSLLTIQLRHCSEVLDNEPKRPTELKGCEVVWSAGEKGEWVPKCLACKHGGC